METIKRFFRRGDVLSGCGVIAISALAIVGMRLEFGRGDWAAWVQAVGSVVALGVAVFVMSRQNAHARDMYLHADRIALLRRATAVEVLVKNGDSTIRASFSHLLGAQENGTYPNFTLSNVEIWMESIIDARKTLESVPLYELSSQKLVSAALVMLEDLLHVSSCYKDWLNAGVAPDTDAMKALAEFFPANELRSCADFKTGVEEMRAA